MREASAGGAGRAGRERLRPHGAEDIDVTVRPRVATRFGAVQNDTTETPTIRAQQALSDCSEELVAVQWHHHIGRG